MDAWVSNLSRETMEFSGRFVEKRKATRVSLRLPVEYRKPEEYRTRGAMMENLSEGGLLVLSTQRMAVGTELQITVLFPEEYELANFDGLAKIAWKDAYFKEDWSGYQYGLEFVHLSEEDRMKLQGLLGHHAMRVDRPLA